MRDSSTKLPVPVQRRYPTAPLVGVAAAVFDPAGQVLLVQRGRPPRAGSWGLPGGLLELGESLADGVQRELREECGVEIAVGTVAGLFEPVTRDAAGEIEYHYVVVDFWASWVSGEAIAQDDAAAAAWVPLNCLNSYAITADAHHLIERAHALWTASRL
ncbi:MAG: NUDIX domain-containing protein [Caldilinea sp.]